MAQKPAGYALTACEITQRTLGYENQIEVLSPAALHKNVAKIARRMVEINNNTQKP